MIHLESLICYSCQTTQSRNLFDSTTRRAIFGTCGHSICSECSDPNRSCPICGRKRSFENGTVNYEAMNLMEYYRDNAIDMFRKWWETLETGIGMCSKCYSKKPLRLCLTCQQAQNWKDVNMKELALCEECAEKGTKRYEGRIHDCDATDIKDKLQNIPNIKCRKCSSTTTNPKLCSICFHITTEHINVDTFSLCADCIIDHHSGHKTSKATENYSIRHSTVSIVQKVLLSKLESTAEEDELKCKLRHMRLLLTGKEAIYRASTHYPLYSDEDCEDPKLLGRPKIPKEHVEKVLSSLEKQNDFLQKMSTPCPCVTIWRDVQKLNILDCHGLPPHFLAMVNKPDLVEVLDECPYELEENRELREKLEEIIERGEALTEPHQKIYVNHGIQLF